MRKGEEGREREGVEGKQSHSNDNSNRNKWKYNF